ncbi:MAG TPA: hypothetical protein VHX38_34600 [Pseudonocardiaceae bacterium]|nr:hypothetical protein [Pseudonocardiaceae bacterium]
MWEILDDIIASIQQEQDRLDPSGELADSSAVDRFQEFSSAE